MAIDFNKLQTIYNNSESDVQTVLSKVNTFIDSICDDAFEEWITELLEYAAQHREPYIIISYKLAPAKSTLKQEVDGGDGVDITLAGVASDRRESWDPLRIPRLVITDSNVKRSGATIFEVLCTHLQDLGLKAIVPYDLPLDDSYNLDWLYDKNNTKYLTIQAYFMEEE